MADPVAEFKLLIIGDSACGKSSLLTRFTDNTFDDDMGPTIGVDFKAKDLNLTGNVVRLKLWDTAGQERFRTLTASYYRGAHGAILVYDVTRPETFEHINMWLSEVEVYSSQSNPVKMLVANKIDLERKVTTEQGLSLAKEKGMLYIECSAKTSKGVQDAFEELSQKILDTPDLWMTSKGGSGVNIRNQEGGGEEPCSACQLI